MFKRLLRGIVQVAVPVAIGVASPMSVASSLVMGAIKHKTKVDNQKIPIANLLLNTGLSFGRQVLMNGVDPVVAIMPAVTEGGLLMAASTGFHQSVKIPMKHHTGRSI